MVIINAMNSINTNHRRQFREVIQLFIEKKMNSYDGIKVALNFREESITIETGKYRASLFMIHSMLRTMEQNEIAAALEMPSDLLRIWENEKIFKTLMYSNYKEFLIYLGELYT
jgi:hypothetical protein